MLDLGCFDCIGNGSSTGFIVVLARNTSENYADLHTGIFGMIQVAYVGMGDDGAGRSIEEGTRAYPSARQ